MRTGRLAIAFALSTAALVACKDAPPPPPKVAAEPDAGQPVEEVSPIGQLRQAYGLPFPPEVQYVNEGVDFVEVGTKLNVDELERFFRGRVVDYEFIRPNRNELRLIGLHSTMPRVYVNKRAPNVPIVVRYVDQSASRLLESAAATPEERPVPGKPVQLKLGEKELAPGAVYGQPYTPQPGDPLYQERYRANFGKPFGKWILN